MKNYASHLLALGVIVPCSTGFVVNNGSPFITSAPPTTTQLQATPAQRTSDKPFFSNIATQRLNNNNNNPGSKSPLIPPPPKESKNNNNNVVGNRQARDIEERIANLERTEQEMKQRMANMNQRAATRESRRPMNEERNWYNQAGGLYSQGYNRQNNNGYNPSQQQQMVGSNARTIDEIWETSTPVTIQGNSLRTWSFANPAVRRVHVLLKTDGRPLDADVQLWHGPDNTPHKMKVYVEDGAVRTFSAFIDTPDGPNSIAIRNIGPIEFPLYACVGPDREASAACIDAVRSVRGEVIQGGALRTYPFNAEVDSVAVLINTNGRPMNARIELLQGPNNNKQVLELYTEDGMMRPLLCIVQTPGSGNVIRVVNNAPVEFPMQATLVEYEYSKFDPYMDGIQIGNDW